MVEAEEEMGDMCTISQLSVITEEIVQAYKKVYGNSLINIYLYGSYARGDYSEYSDIDYAAIVDGDRLQLQAKLDDLWDISSEISLKNDVVISPTVIPKKEFDKYRNSLPYYRNICKEGRQVG